MLALDLWGVPFWFRPFLFMPFLLCTAKSAGVTGRVPQGKAHGAQRSSKYVILVPVKQHWARQTLPCNCGRAAL
jgi:hypothetical protein